MWLRTDAKTVPCDASRLRCGSCLCMSSQQQRFCHILRLQCTWHMHPNGCTLPLLTPIAVHSHVHSRQCNSHRSLTNVNANWSSKACQAEGSVPGGSIHVVQAAHHAQCLQQGITRSTRLRLACSAFARCRNQQQPHSRAIGWKSGTSAQQVVPQAQGNTHSNSKHLQYVTNHYTMRCLQQHY